MRATILVHDNIVRINDRTLTIDCSSVDQNIRVVQWYDSFGEIEFNNDAGQAFFRNGKLDTLDEFRPIIDAWFAWADAIDSSETLKTMPMVTHHAIIDKINGSAKLKAKPFDDAVKMVLDIQRDPSLLAMSTDQAVTELENRPSTG
jgi:hypothetical protein